MWNQIRRKAAWLLMALMVALAVTGCVPQASQASHGNQAAQNVQTETVESQVSAEQSADAEADGTADTQLSAETSSHADQNADAQSNEETKTQPGAEQNKQAEANTEANTEANAEANAEANTEANTEPVSQELEEDGSYTSKEDVALYLHTYGCLPDNFITKKEAQNLGWDSKKGNLWDVAPGKSIGGSHFGNYEKLLPEKKGRKYYECDLNYEGGYRGAERMIYSNDGLIFYTGDHYESFEQLY